MPRHAVIRVSSFFKFAAMWCNGDKLVVTELRCAQRDTE